VDVRPDSGARKQPCPPPVPHPATHPSQKSCVVLWTVLAHPPPASMAKYSRVLYRVMVDTMMPTWRWGRGVQGMGRRAAMWRNGLLAPTVR
jgi:hypothetical protein